EHAELRQAAGAANAVPALARLVAKTLVEFQQGEALVHLADRIGRDVGVEILGLHAALFDRAGVVVQELRGQAAAEVVGDVFARGIFDRAVERPLRVARASIRIGSDWNRMHAVAAGRPGRGANPTG